MATSQPQRLRLTLQAGERAQIPDVSRAQIRRWMLAALDRPAEITLRFVGTREGKQLNQAYRSKAYATNVLTFDYSEPGESGVTGRRSHTMPLRADIVICMSVVSREARQQHKAERDHLAHLIIHGTLHAMGHDHQSDSEAEAMESLEIHLLRRFRIGDPYRAPASRRLLS